jgi:hypothetical protein
MFVDMKHIVCILALLLFVQLQSLPAQDTKKLRVAVFDPSSTGTSIDEGTKIAVREIISSTFVNTEKYTMVERSMLDKVMKELKFSNTEVVDDSQATEIGKLAGANKVVLSVITMVGGRNMLSIKTIDVQTATIDLQKTRVVSSNDLLEVVEPLTLEMLGERVSPIGPKVKPGRDPRPAPAQGDPVDGQSVILEFAGMLIDKNPEAYIYVDGKLVGEGTFNGGFYVTFSEQKSGKHKVTIKWSGNRGVINSEDYVIDTRKQRKFTFTCAKGRLYYVLEVKYNTIN